jgi:LPS-assembly lipoprotein
MWLSDRRIFLLGALALGACGFTPVHAPEGDPLRAQIALADPTDRNDFDYVGQLERRLGRATAPSLDLTYEITVTRSGGGYTPDGAITRFTLEGTARFVLTDRATGAQRGAGRVQSFVSYATTGTTVATMSAETDAYKRLMVILADQTVTRLMALGLQ